MSTIYDYADYAYVWRGPCTLWLFVCHHSAHGRGLGAPGDPRGSPALPPGRAPILVCDHLNTYAYVSFYRVFPPAEARRLTRRVQMVFTSRHGSWLPQGRTGTERSDPRVGGEPQRGPKRHPLVVLHRGRPRAPQTSILYNGNLTEY